MSLLKQKPENVYVDVEHYDPETKTYSIKNVPATSANYIKYSGLQEYKNKPIEFIRDFFPYSYSRLASYQKDILTYGDKIFSMPNPRDPLKKNFTSAYQMYITAKGVGKSYVAALKAIFTLLTEERPIIMILSSTKDTLIRTLITKIRELIAGSEHFKSILHLTNKEVKLRPFGIVTDDNQRINFVTDNGNKRNTLQGEHTPSIHLVIIDEAITLKESTYDQIVGMETEGKLEVIMLTNPVIDISNNYFVSLMREKLFQPNWFIKHLSVYDIEGNWYNRQTVIDQYGDNIITSTLYVMGQFCETTTNTFFHTTKVKNMIERSVSGTEPFKLNHQVIIGVDVAYGIEKDYTVFFARKGYQIYLLEYDNTMNLDKASRLCLEYAKLGCVIAIDCHGVGKQIGLTFDSTFKSARLLKFLGGDPTGDGRYFDRNSVCLHALKEYIASDALELYFRPERYNPQVVKSKILRESECFLETFKQRGSHVYTKSKAKSCDLIRSLSYTFPHGIGTDNYLFCKGIAGSDIKWHNTKEQSRYTIGGYK